MLYRVTLPPTKVPPIFLPLTFILISPEDPLRGATAQTSPPTLHLTLQQQRQQKYLQMNNIGECIIIKNYNYK